MPMRLNVILMIYGLFLQKFIGWNLHPYNLKSSFSCRSRSSANIFQQGRLTTFRTSEGNFNSLISLQKSTLFLKFLDDQDIEYFIENIVCDFYRMLCGRDLLFSILEYKPDKKFIETDYDNNLFDPKLSIL